MDFEFLIQKESSFDPFDLNRQYELSRKTIHMDKSCEELIDNIREQINHIEARGFKAEYILMNTRNYERLIAYAVHLGRTHGAPDDTFEGYQIIIWDVPIDYVNVRCKASDEWAYGEAIRKGASK